MGQNSQPIASYKRLDRLLPGTIRRGWQRQPKANDMRDEILTYWEMCAREKGSLQRGMYYREPPGVSVVLMSRRPGAPYDDSLSDDGTELEYEGHDAKRKPGADPKSEDQPWSLPSGEPTENGKFAKAAQESVGQQPLVRAYEKLRPGIWSDRGLFHLVRHEYTTVGTRKVFKFFMRLTDLPDVANAREDVKEFRRVIPSWVKQVVYKRDKGRCVICTATDHLHFDHELPYSKGGAGLTPENVRILCARHNLEKGSRIE